jgi:hypothetical protein
MALMVPLWSALILVPSVQAGSNLLENSPFLPAGQLAGAAQETAPLELRSIVKDGGGYEFSLYDPARRQSIWVGLKEPGHEFLVKAFDPATDAITVEQRNRTYTLTLKEARITPLMATPGAPTAVNGSVAQLEPAIQAGQNNELTPQEEQILRRREAIVQRLRESRRRAGDSFPLDLRMQQSGKQR